LLTDPEKISVTPTGTGLFTVPFKYAFAVFESVYGTILKKKLGYTA